MPWPIPDPMKLRVPRALAITAATLGGLFVAYLLFAWLAFEPLVQWVLPRHLAQHGGYRLTIGQAGFHPLRLAATLRDLALRQPDGQPLLTLARLTVNVDATGLFRRAWSFDEVSVDAPVVSIVLRPDGGLNWLDLVHALSDPAAPPSPPDTAPTRLVVQRLAISGGAIELTDRQVGGGFHTRADALALELHHLSTLPQDRGDHTLSVQTGIGATLRWRGEFGLNPVFASGELAVDRLLLDRLWPYLRGHLQTEPPQGEAALKFAYNARYRQGRFDLDFERIEGKLSGLALRGAGAAQPALALDALALAGGRIDLSSRQVSFDRIEIGPGRLALQRAADGRLDVQDWLRADAAAAAAPATPASAAVAAAGAASAASPAWQLQLGQLALHDLGLQFTDRGFAAPLNASVEKAQLALRLQGRFGGGAEPALDIEASSLQLDGLRIAGTNEQQAWFELASLALAETRVSLHERQLAAGSLGLTGGRLRVERDSAGRVTLPDRWRRSETAAAPPADTPAAAGAPWRFKLGRMQAQDFGIALHDASVKPPLTLAITELQAEASELSQDLAAAVPVALRFRVDRGGQFEARGRVTPGGPAADLQLRLRDLSLVPAQPFVAQATALTLSGGRAATQGRLRFDPKRWRYEGAFDITGVRFDEAATGERFLGWDRLHSPTLALGSHGLRIGELRVEGLGAKLVIAKDRSVNVAHMLKPAAASAPAPTPPTPSKPADPPYPIAIDRVNVAGGSVDFADLSLALPFGTRIHQLQGQMVGLTSAGTAPATVELDGKVDDYGLARAAGQIRLFDPSALTDLKVVFRNVEMSTLTPYSATFAGRRIASGKLSLDLDYKIHARQLAGENRFVMERLTLGEAVDAPGASKLPLDLAIAILEDADGRIDLAIPVSGSLDDPQFSYGRIIGQAILNVLTKIVTAPFRALGALFGGGGESAPEAIGFDAGRSELLPPEREKLVRLGAALARRPGLALAVQPRFDPQADAQALREQALRRAVAQAAGRSVADGEDPGPLVTTEPATRAALEKLYAQRFGAAELQALQQRHQQANPAPPPAGAGAQVLSRLGSLLQAAPPPLPPQEAERLRGADLHALLLQRLLEAQAVDEAALRALADARGAAIRTELVARGVAAERLQLAAAERSPADNNTAGAGRVVQTGLGLAAGPRAAASAPAR